jgi:hypothetical protein
MLYVGIEHGVSHHYLREWYDVLAGLTSKQTNKQNIYNYVWIMYWLAMIMPQLITNLSFIYNSRMRHSFNYQ